MTTTNTSNRSPREARLAIAFGFLLIAILLPCSRAVGCDECAGKVKVTFMCRADGVHDTTLNGVTVHGDSGGPFSTNNDGTFHVNGYSVSNTGVTDLEPDKVYQIQVSGDAGCYHIQVSAPGCYKVVLDGYETTALGATDFGPYARTHSLVITSESRQGSAGGGGSGESSLNTGDRGVHWESSMGGQSTGAGAGMLRFDAGTLNADSYTPAGLKYSLDWMSQFPITLPQPPVEVVTTGDLLRQVKAPESLADIQMLSVTSYEVRYYLPTDVGEKSAETGLYAVSGSPLVTWRFEIPPGGTIGRDLRVTEIRDGLTMTRDYSTDATGNTWTMTQAGLRQDSSVTTALPGGDRQTVTTVTDLIRTEVVAQRKEVRHTFAWGEETIQTAEDPLGEALTTTYSFYDDPLQPGQYGRLKSVVHHDGRWEKYVYHEPTVGGTDSSTAGLVKYVMRPWLDGPADPALATMLNCRVTEFGYQPGVFDYDLQSEPLFEQETVLGVVTARREFTDASDYNFRDVTTDLFSGSAIKQSVNTRAHRANYIWPYTSRLSWLVKADGTVEEYAYHGGTYDSATGIFTEGAGDTVRATLMRNANGWFEVPFKSVRTVTVSDAGGRIVLDKNQVVTGSGASTLTKRMHDYWPSGKLKQTTENGRVVYEAAWSGEHLISETDEQGIVTAYSNFDGMGHPQATTRAGVTVTTEYDALGRKRSVTRSGGGLSVTGGTDYDVAGRIISETDEDGLTTGYDYSPDGRTKTVTHPNGATTITVTFLDGQTKSITGTAQVAQYFHPSVDAVTGNRTLRVYAAADLSARWTETVTDWAGSTIAESHPSQAGAVTRNSLYNNLGQLVGVQRTGMAVTVFEYDELGRASRRGLDLNSDSTLVPASMDRFEEADFRYEQIGGEWHEVDERKTYLADNDATPTTLRKTLRTLTGLASGTMSDVTIIDSRGQSTHVVETVDRATATVTRTTAVPGSTISAVEVTTNGRLVSSSSATVAAAMTFQYDGLGRLWKTTDPRTSSVVETRTYHPGTSQLATVTTLVGTTTYAWYPNGDANAGLLKSVTGPDGTTTRYSYNIRGQFVRTWGSATYPVEYVYDDLGQQTGVRTFRTEQGWDGNDWPANPVGDLTQWGYDPGSGELTSKTDPATRAVNYERTFTATGAMLTRTWARTVGAAALSTIYNYNLTGDLTGVDYSDTTPDVTIAPDRIGRPHTVMDGAGTRTLAHHADGALESETFNAGLFTGLVMTRTPDVVGRLSGITLISGTTNLLTQGYGYDPGSGRLASASHGEVSADFSYLANSDLAQATTFAYSSASRMTTTHSYDTAGRLKNIASQRPGPAQPVSAVGYEFDAAGRRNRQFMADGTAWHYDYNDRGEVSGASRKWADASAVAGQQFTHEFDAIGNRMSTTVNGRIAAYTANGLNQYLDRGVPGYVDIVGRADAAAAVTVNNYAATRQSGGYFHSAVPVVNSSSGAWQGMTIRATQPGAGPGGTDLVAEQFGYRWLPPATETFVHDNDGNLTSDGRWTYTWDAENRLVRAETRTDVPADMPRVRVDHAYDYRSRRVRTVASQWNGSAWVVQRDARFVYSGGWNQIAELDAGNSPIRSQLWGNDLSGSEEGAGGVGGLLCLTVHQGVPADLIGAYITSYDGNGNIIALIKASDGTQAATYEYGPFGELLRTTGPAAELNPFRFSTKYHDDDTGLDYYGYRYLRDGRWLSRDPIEEEGGMNVYAFVTNLGVNAIDLAGRQGIAQPYRQMQVAKETLDATDNSANDQIKNALKEYMTGGPKKLSYGPSDSWTKALQKHSHLDGLRSKIRKEYIKRCSGSYGATRGQEDFSLNALSLAQNLQKLLRDIAAPFLDLNMMNTSGSIRFRWQQRGANDCCRKQVEIEFVGTDTLRLGSMTRIPKTAIEIVPDNVFGANGPFHNVDLEWNWTETISY